MINKIFIICILLLCSNWGFSQTEQQRKLELRKAQILKEIQVQEKLLRAQDSKQKSLLNSIVAQKEKIRLRETLISTTEKQAKLLNDDIYTNQLEINKLNRELKVLKEDYSELILKSYKSRSEQSKLMFILSSENFNQAYKRTEYMKQYANFRKQQGLELEKKSKELFLLNEKLDKQKAEKQKIINEQEQEKIALEKEKKEQEKTVNSIKKDKTKIVKEIKKRQEETRKIDRQIEKIIRDAIAEANRKAAEAKRKANANNKAPAGKNTPKTSASPKAIENSSVIVLTPEGKLISDSFKANRGRLPWPVESGKISQKFGDQPHPIERSIRVHNNGIEITTNANSRARAVFDGEVSNIFVITPTQMSVVIRHGDFFTAYTNLSSVNVSKGDVVKTKQNIGTIRTNNDTGRTTLKFQISQNVKHVNPEIWLSK